MLFVGVDEKGEKITSGPEVEKWTNGCENFSFLEKNGVTQVTVEMDITEDFLDYMNESYPKALAKLKELCEG